MGSFLLPQVKSEAGESAEKGTAFHALVESFFKEGRTIPDSASPTERLLLRRIRKLVGPPAGLFERPELACVLQPSNGISELLSVSRGFDSREPFYHRLHNGSHESAVEQTGGQPAPHVESGSRHGVPVRGAGVGTDSVFVDRAISILAIADFVQIFDGSTIAVYDWKTGAWPGDPKWSWQLIVPAVAVWIIAGRPSEFRSTGYLVGVDLATGRIKPVKHVLSARDLANYERHLRNMVERAGRQDPATVTLYEGKHCAYCPARDRCPAKIGALTKAMENFLWADVSDLELIKGYVALTESKFSNNKVAYEILERHGNVMDLGDGRDAVLTVKSGRRSVYTRKHVQETNVEQDGSNAAEDDNSGAQGE